MVLILTAREPQLVRALTRSTAWRVAVRGERWAPHVAEQPGQVLIVSATFALIDNPGINGHCLTVDAGLQLT
ncbi:MAG: hypothetical protein QOC63_392 [Mycobacterium sp.]|jgi:hypothetical protein|nr:hypothetical protein [Mycobacterium sp.]